MSPKELAEALRGIARKIDNSVQPSRSLVASDLRQLLAGVQTAALNPEDVKGLKETIEKLNALISNENASDRDIEAAISKLQEVKNSVKRVRMREQLNPKAAPMPLRSIHDQPLTRKTGSVDLTYAIDWSSRDDEDGEYDEVGVTRLTRSDGKFIAGAWHADGGKGSMRGGGDWDELENTTELSDDVAGALLEQLDRHDFGQGDWGRLFPAIAQLTQENQKAGSVHWGDDGV